MPAVLQYSDSSDSPRSYASDASSNDTMSVTPSFDSPANSSMAQSPALGRAMTATQPLPMRSTGWRIGCTVIGSPNLIWKCGS